MKNLWRELRRRHVFRIAGVYAAVGMVFLEVIANVLPMFEAPLWIGKTLMLLILLFFPVALVIAWAFEITPDGIVRDDRAPDQAAVLPPALPDYLIIAALAIVIGLTFADLSTQPIVEEREAIDAEVSIGVLPFVDFSEDSSNQHIGNGIAESVLNALATTDGLRVASRTSSFSAKNSNLDVSEIGGRLNVTEILEGSIRLQSNKLRVSAQLTDVKSGYQRWSKTYERQFDDIFSIEEDIARSLVLALRGPLELGEDSIVQSWTDNVDAYELNLRAKYYFDSPSQENFVKATQLFREATALDPNYWTAQGYLAFCLGYASIYSSYSDQAVTTAISTELALANDPDNVPALLIKGFMADAVDIAEPFYQRALSIDRDQDLALYTYHNDYLWPQSRHLEGRALIKLALKEDPDSVLLLQPLAMLESRDGNYDEALRLISNVGDQNGGNFLVSSVLADVFNRQGDATRLKQIAEESISKIGRQNGFMLHYLIRSEWMSGNNQRAFKLIEEMKNARDVGEHMSATVIGLNLAALGYTDEAVGWLVQANREKDFWLRWHLREALEEYPELARSQVLRNISVQLGLDDESIAKRRARYIDGAIDRPGFGF